MSEFNVGGIPGVQTTRESTESQITWAGRQGQDLAATKQVVIGATAVDAGNSPSTTLRAGLVLSQKTSDGKYYPYNPDATDGTQIAVGVLEKSQSMLVNGAATDRFTQILVQGLLRDNRLHGHDIRAKTQLGQRFVFDRETSGQAGTLLHPRGVKYTLLDHTVTPADNGLMLVALSGVVFTLPEKENGLAFRFLQASEASLTIAGTFDMVAQGNASASSVVFDTAGQRMGSQVLVECLYVGENMLRWVVSNLGGTTATVS